MIMMMTINVNTNLVHNDDDNDVDDNLDNNIGAYDDDSVNTNLVHNDGDDDKLIIFSLIMMVHGGNGSGGSS